MTNFTIKFHHLYYNAYPISYSADYRAATKFAHPDNARQEIIEKKLGEDHKVYQMNVVEIEVK